MKSLDHKMMEKFLKEAGGVLEGRWVLIGGTLLLALEEAVRPTVDIDLVGLGKEELSQTLALMKLSEKLGLPVETINQAGSYFLHKIKNFEEKLIPLLKTKKCEILRPNLELYWELKVARLSERDLDDCLSYFDYVKRKNEVVDFKKLKSILKNRVLKDISSEQKNRIAFLEKKLKE